MKAQTAPVTAFVIMEHYENWRGAHTSTRQRHASLREALRALPQAVAERFGCETPEEWERIHRSRLEDHFTSPARDRWVMDDETEHIELRIHRRRQARHGNRA